MDLDAYLASLADKHAGLEKAIDEEIQRPQPDGLLLSDLKRQKLRLKDEMTRLRAEQPVQG